MGLDWPRLRQAAFTTRRAKQWTQSTLAEKAGVSIATVRRFERGEHVQDLETVTALTDALGLPLPAFDALVSRPVIPGTQTAQATPEVPVSDSPKERMAHLILGLTPAQAAALEGAFQRWLFSRLQESSSGGDTEDD